MSQISNRLDKNSQSYTQNNIFNISELDILVHYSREKSVSRFQHSSYGNIGLAAVMSVESYVTIMEKVITRIRQIIIQ